MIHEPEQTEAAVVGIDVDVCLEAAATTLAGPAPTRSMVPGPMAPHCV